CVTALLGIRDTGHRRLLCGSRQRKFAVADAFSKTFGKARDRLFPIGRHEFGEGGEEECLRQSIAVDSVEPGLVPGLAHVAERGSLEFVISGRIGDLHDAKYHWPSQPHAPTI